MRAAPSGLSACLVLDDPSWHRGVIGILASRVVDRTGQPALVLSHEDGQAYGSGRSVSGFHLLEALTSVHAEEAEPLFARFGGHAHAVGFSLPSHRVEELRRRMVRHAQDRLSGDRTEPALECHAELLLRDITPAFLSALERLGPFGNGNADPVFLARDTSLATAAKVIKDRHLRLLVEQDGVRFGGMAWSRRTDWAALAEAWGLAPGSRVDLAFRLRRNRHPDFGGGWEMEILALRPTLEAPHPPESTAELPSAEPIAGKF